MIEQFVQLQKQQPVAQPNIPEDDTQFSGKCVLNQPIKIKATAETVEEQILTEEILQEQINLNNTFFSNCKHLNIKILNLASCQIIELPDNVGKMVNIQELFLSHNYFQIAPQILESFKYLKVLDLSFNQISVFNLNIQSLKMLNLACNMLEYPCVNLLNVLCLQMNPIKIITKEFSNVLKQLQIFEFDWFKYCSPILPQKFHSLQFPSQSKKLITTLEQKNLSFQDFVDLLSFGECDFQSTDYKGRNLFCQAGQRDEIGVLIGLNSVIQDQLNQRDLNNNTPLTVCYLENKMSEYAKVTRGKVFIQSNSLHQLSSRYLEPYLFNVLKQRNMFHHFFKQPKTTSTPLHLLMRTFGNYETSKEFALILIKNGSNLNEENYDGFTPLEVSVRNHQIEAIKFAFWFNLSDNINEGKYFNFHYQTKKAGYGIIHTSVLFGDIQILQFLSEINIDFFQITKKNKLPRHFATQSLSHMKNLRKLESIWLLKNIIKKQQIKSYQEPEISEILQMQNQIDKCNAQRKTNFQQKFLDQEDLEVKTSFGEYVEGDFSTNEQTEERNMLLNYKSLVNQQELIDYYSEIIKFLRNGNFGLAVHNFKLALNQNLPISERIKYKNHLLLLISKFKLKNGELRAIMGNGTTLELNDYQIKTKKEEKRQQIKELKQLLKSENYLELEEAEQTIKSFQFNNTKFQEQKELQIQYLDKKNCSQLFFEVNNLVVTQQLLQKDLYNQLYITSSINQKRLKETGFWSLQNYEYLQQMKFKKKYIVVGKDQIASKIGQNYNNLKQEDFKIPSMCKAQQYK